MSGASTLTYNSGTGALTGTSDLNFNFAATENLRITSDLATASVNIFELIATPSNSAGTKYGLYFQQADGTGTQGLNAGVVVENSDTNLVINDAFLITTAAGGITDAIDASDSDINNALNLGSNTITGAGYLITSTASGLNINSTSADLAFTTTTSGDISATTAVGTGNFHVKNGNLRVGNGTSPDVTLNGEDAYIEGTLEVDGAVRLDNLSTNGLVTVSGGVLSSSTTIGSTYITNDDLDFIDFQNALDLDANLTIAQTTYTWAQTYTGTGTGFTYTASGASGVAANFVAGSGATQLQLSYDGSNYVQFDVGSTGILTLSESGTDIASFGEGQISFDVPTAFNAAGDAAFGYDLILSNQTSSKIESYGPLIIEAGENFENNNLTLKTYGTGKVILEPASTGSISLSGATNFGTIKTLANDATPDVSGGSWFVTGGTTSITDFDAGSGTLVDGHIIFIRSEHTVTLDCLSGTPELNCGATDITLGNGDLISFIYDSENDLWVLLNWYDVDDTQSGGADLAELFASENKLSAGEIVTVDSNNPIYIKKSSSSYLSNALGIVSTTPGIVLGEGNYTGIETYPIALAGRVPVKVSDEGGNIAIGDPITTSSTPGVGMKATRAGKIIGYALENFTETSGDIVVFINSTWYDPQTTLTADGNLNLSGNLTVQGINVMDTINALSGATGANQTESQVAQLTYEVSVLTGQVAGLNDLVADLLDTPQTTQSSQSTSSENPLAEILTLINEFKTFVADLGLSSSTNGEGERVLTIENKLIALNDSTFSNVAINGKLNLGFMEFDAVENTFGIVGSSCFNPDTELLNQEMCQLQTLYMQKDLTGNIDFFDGGVVFTPDGSLVATGDVKAKSVTTKELRITGTTLGSATLGSGEISIEIETTLVKENSRIFITPTTSTFGKTLFVKSKTDGVEFKVEIDSPAAGEIKFDWFIVNEN
jgi:hypothetical protein